MSVTVSNIINKIENIEVFTLKPNAVQNVNKLLNT